MQLFMPQIFQATHDYQVAHDGQSTDLCNILKTSTGAQQSDDCTVVNKRNYFVPENITLAFFTELRWQFSGISELNDHRRRTTFRVHALWDVDQPSWLQAVIA